MELETCLYCGNEIQIEGEDYCPHCTSIIDMTGDLQLNCGITYCHCGQYKPGS